MSSCRRRRSAAVRPWRWSSTVSPLSRSTTSPRDQVDPQYPERVFDMLERLHGKEVPGTGIGLSVTRRIAELHGETVRIGDNPGGRTTVTFTLQTPHKMGDEHNITKPLVPTEFLATIRSIEDYRITTVRLPTRPV